LADGARLGGEAPLPTGARATAHGRAEPSTGVFAYGLDDGRAVVLRQRFRVSYPGDRRVVTPALERPLGEAPLVLDEDGAAVVRIAVQDAEDEATVAGLLDDGRVVLVHLAKTVSLLDESVSLERTASEVPAPGHPVDYLLLDRRQQALYLAARDGRLSHYDVRDKSAPRLVERLRLVPEGRELTALAFLNGDYSLLAGDSGGTVRQWTLVRLRGEQRLRARGCSPSRRGPTGCCSRAAAGSRSGRCATSTRRSRGRRSGDGCGTRATTAPCGSGSPRPRPTTSSPSTA